jgi:hypothetical protein
VNGGKIGGDERVMDGVRVGGNMRNVSDFIGNVSTMFPVQWKHEKPSKIKG